MKRIYFYLLVLIFLLAGFLRFYNLSQFPVGFHIDEASLGYNAYSLLLTGKDANGDKWPLYISMFNDNNPSGYYYMAMLPIKFLGLTVFATRFPAALFGSLSIFAMYLLCFAIFRNRKISLLAALLTGIAPWSIVLSRTSAEALVALFFVTFGFACIILNLRNRKFVYIILGTVSLLASLFIYPAPRVFVPLLFLILLLYYIPAWYQKNHKQHMISIVASFLFISIVSVILVFLVKGGAARFNQVSIFSFPSTKLILEEQIRESGVLGISPFVTRIFHNKLINYSKTFISNYFQYFSGNFLFIKGGLPLLLRVPEMGLVYITELPFIIWGIISLAVHKNKFYKIPLLWLLPAPVATALTVDDSPNVRRALVMFPAIELIAAYGFYVFMAKFSGRTKQILSLCVGLILFFNLAYFLQQYFYIAKVDKPWYRNNGVSQLVATIEKSQQQYDKVVITKGTGGIYPIILFYLHYDPAKYQQEGSPGDKDYHGFGKIVFVPQDCPSLNSTGRNWGKNVIYVDRGDCPLTKQIEQMRYINILRGDGTKAFRIVYE